MAAISWMDLFVVEEVRVVVLVGKGVVKVPFFVFFFFADTPFGSRSKGWEGGGVASIAPLKGADIYGSVVELTPKEKAALDQHEGAYVSASRLASHCTHAPLHCQRYGFRAAVSTMQHLMPPTSL